MAFPCLRCRAELDPAFRACPHCGEPVTDFLRRHRDEPVDGKYRVLERLGTGGMGEVYKVEHTYLGTTRVIKVIRAQISDNRDANDRFLREARLATKVQHPNVATLHDFAALPDGSHYMVWEFIDGENLAERIRRRGTLAPREAVHIAIQALHGLDAIHRAGIVHRDISPENLMLTGTHDGEEHLKIIDLGVAKMDSAVGEVVTQTGIFVGKLRYASPEHLGFLGEGERIDGRADLYSLAIVLYEMLAGRPPFEATSPHQYLMLHAKETRLEPLQLPADLPGGEELQRVLRRALEHDRNRRYATARELAAALETVERALPPPFDAEATMRVTPAPAPPVTRAMTTDVGNETIAATKRAPFYTPDVPRQTVAAMPAPAAMTPPAAVPSATETSTSSAATISATATPAARSTRSISRPSAAPKSTRAAAPPTVVEPLPPATSVRTIAVAAIVLTLTLAAIALGYYWSRPAAVEPQAPARGAAATGAPSHAATATFEVVTGTDPSPAPVANSGTAATASVPAGTPPGVSAPSSSAPANSTSSSNASANDARANPPQPSSPPATREREPEAAPANAAMHAERPQEPAAGASHAYTEGSDGDANEAALAELRRAVAGTTSVGIVGGAMNDELLKVLQKSTKGISFHSGSADVTIHFDGTFERLGRGRKRRAARAVITKGGRVVFRYELPAEDYRFGDNPAEAFAQVIADSFQ
jgi:serine/threonine protein kinase